jgi:hypothetical protein
VTLLYSSHDTEHNNAVALKEYIEHKGDVKSRTAGTPLIGRADASQAHEGWLDYISRGLIGVGI